MNWLDPYVVWSLRDPRDTVFVKTTLWLSLGVLSSLYLVLVRFTWWHFALHAAWVGKHATTYVLMLHCVCHRPLYKAKYHALNWIAPYALGPFYGHTWDTFYFHHIKHHHIEDNGPHDLSSTLRYQRDSALHFFIYFSRFFLFTLIELPRYFLQKGWYATAVRVVFMEAATWSLFASLAYIGRNYTSSQPELVNFAATLTLAVPVALMRFGMMSGNWAQHAFVDRSRPDCDYVQSLTCINNPYNDLAFNDGYHTSHHLNPRRHWADHPGNLVACADDYAKHGTLVFTGIDFHVTWFYLMTKNYKALAQAYVHLDNDKPRPSDEEIMAMLKSRTKQMTQEEVDAYYSQTKTKLAARKTQ
ncbi:hypothetical protein BCR44DRAFT_131530 [Catenaria anguillulae PL171]|uniref:Fatty acid desaturase domain-containing protein n=1 Tax=Catenaria anguillulae PL171 TaxID=765915 RepID=A0A1Y2HPY0_9FUNG|nr:hypothetical protein BCR44DRAFT_131530 [Catenaria anguillulae PL171]